MMYQKRVPEEIKINDALSYILVNASVNVLSLLDHTHIWREIIKYALLYKRRVRLAFVLLSEDNKGKKRATQFSNCSFEIATHPFQCENPTWKWKWTLPGKFLFWFPTLNGQLLNEGVTLKHFSWWTFLDSVLKATVEKRKSIKHQLCIWISMFAFSFLLVFSSIFSKV